VVLRVGRVSHVIGERVESFAEMGAQLVGHVLLGERAVHAPQPLVAFTRADGKRQVTRAQAGMSVFLDIDLWATRPAGEVEIQLFAC